MNRRSAIQLLVAAGTAACSKTPNRPQASGDAPGLPSPGGVERAARKAAPSKARRSAVNPVKSIEALPPSPTPWPTPDPFLFCVHHNDHYPRGNESLGPAETLAGRTLGSDFAAKDGWNMYHGEVVPGFPQHPHRGFETVTVVRRGLLDHSDSLGAAARYGQGDVQWLTAGSGIQHAEMFPLLEHEQDNPLELFQIWLNLPRAGKMVAPYFSMLWADRIPTRKLTDGAGRGTSVTIVAGRLGDVQAPDPPPDSWAANPDHKVAIWALAMEPGAEFVLPEASRANRMLYFFAGHDLEIAGQAMPARHSAALEGSAEVPLKNGSARAELLLLQGLPIGEPVAKHGPFVMNTAEEIRTAYRDYQQTGFGGWPWSTRDPIHGREAQRFARHADGRLERPA